MAIRLVTSDTTGSSRVPSIWSWLARICSTRVEPARGMPMTKIGVVAGSGGADCDAGGNRAGCKSAPHAIQALRELGGIMGPMRPFARFRALTLAANS